MSHSNLDFSCLKDQYGGLLTPDDLHLFYYDIGFDKEIGDSFIYSWDHEIEKYCDENGLNIDFCELDAIPSSVPENTILFDGIENDQGNKAVALFRHLRNAFAHYYIGSSGDFYCMKDYWNNEDTITMIGKIRQHLFKGLIEEFFKQKEKNEKEKEKYYHPEV